MLSRRSVRIKIIQLLYSMDRDSELTFKEVQLKYKSSIDDSYNLFLFAVYNLERIISMCNADEKHRKSKHLPGDYDKAFTNKLYNNPIINNVSENEGLQKKFKTLGFTEIQNDDFYKKIYDAFSKTEAYKEYILTPEEESTQHLDILLEFFRFCRKSEYFEETLDDKYPCWIDDKSLIIGVIKKYLKVLESNPEEYLAYYPDTETTDEFGVTLLNTVHKHDASLMTKIEAVLKNWDSERLAIIDTIILKLSLCEMLHFPTIPAKVTINEYVEISKSYSTDKSKEFINGVLDKLMKDLSDEGEIKKTGRGLVD